MSRVRAAETVLPLSALLSQALVAFTIECDNEFEHQMPHRTTRFGSTPGATKGPWLISMAMWAHCLRHVPEEGIPAMELARRAQLSRRDTEMILRRMGRRSWGYLDITPDPDGAARSAWRVRPTPAGVRAQRIWEPLADVVATRWRTRFGASNLDRLRSALSTLVVEQDVGLPGFLPITELGGSLRVRSGPAHPPTAAPSSGGPPLFTLMAGLLVAFAAEVERATGLSFVLSANVVRVLDDAGVPVPRLSELTGIAGMGIENSLSALQRRGHLAVERDRAGGRARRARLTALGVEARAAYFEGVAEFERGWGRPCGGQALRAAREALEVLVGSGTAPDSPLLAGLTPYPDGWRAQVPAPQTLPHYPFVSHRGGFPDGS